MFVSGEVELLTVGLAYTIPSLNSGNLFVELSTGSDNNSFLEITCC